MKVKLGRKYRDKVTGFEGVAVSIHTYLQGCNRISMERLSPEGDKIISLAFDEPNLEPADARQFVEPGDGSTGGPHDHDTSVDAH